MSDIADAMRNEKVLGVAKNDMKEKYAGQWIAAVEVDGYICGVPYIVIGDKEIFLKTAYRSRVLNKKFKK